MDTWTITITLRGNPLDEAGLHELVAALPRDSSAGRSPYGGQQLRVGLHLLADYPEQAVAAARVLVHTALAAIGADDLDDPVAVEVLTEDEADRRDVDLDPFAGLIGADEAATILGVTPNAVRQRAEALLGRRVAGTYLFLRPAIEAAARERDEDLRRRGTTAADRAAADGANLPD